ncbi:GH16783 [Drosophila grimshawi]|uniref:GH16783 n=1 Tax=Drosophila grimshawi TaxID=7222 RepID=B4J3S9_DROGR|nr:GH16783 [Drosophila grimshawi]
MKGCDRLATDDKQQRIQTQPGGRRRTAGEQSWLKCCQVQEQEQHQEEKEEDDEDEDEDKDENEDHYHEQDLSQ